MDGRETIATINLDNLSYNINKIQEVTGKSLFGVVKANAYGHGDVECSRIMIEENLPFICVSSIDEAQRLVHKGINYDILIFSYVDPKIIAEQGKEHFIYTIPSIQWFREVTALNLNLRMHLEINVGMNRIGIKNDKEIEEILSSDVPLEGIYTHLPSPENLEKGKEQLTRFENIINASERNFKWIHVGNAPVSLIKDNTLINGFRMGLAVYGYRVDIPSLKPVLSLHSKICHIDRVNPGESIGYDYTYLVEKKEYFGTMPIGYADCIDVRNNLVPVYIKGKPYSIVGKICMDQTMIRIDESVYLGDEVELIGPHRTCVEIESITGISKYIQLSTLSERITRHYTRKGQVVYIEKRK